MTSATPTLETDRLRLGPWRLDHFEPLVALFADAETTRFIGGTMEKKSVWGILHMRIGIWVAHGFGLFAIEEKATGKLVGWSGLIRHFDWPEHEIGYTIDRSSWGRGYATEASRAALAWAFAATGLGSLVSYVHPDNLRSARVAEKLGAAREGAISLRGIPVNVWRHRAPA